tara:strand:+ start:246 stop:818 length:573 start_codon:yes stop_codon:yes gene_type:complete
MVSTLKVIKFFLAFWLSVPSSIGLQPGKLPSGKERVYKYNRCNPELDIKKITLNEASFVSRHWLNNILQPKRICQEDALIIEKINSLEKFIQEQFTDNREVEFQYLAWTPQGITQDILFIIVVETTENENILKMLINSPFWESNQINTECLLESLCCFSNVTGKKLEINSFLSNNVRYKLIWRDFKIELF